MTDVVALKESGQLYSEGGFFEAECMYKVTYEAGFATLPSDITACVNAVSGYLAKQVDSAGMKKETISNEYSYEKFESQGNLIKELGLNIILDYYRTPTIS
jgi:hypothetical protein